MNNMAMMITPRMMTTKMSKIVARDDDDDEKHVMPSHSNICAQNDSMCFANLVHISSDYLVKVGC